MFFVSLRRGSEINSTWLITRQPAREKHYSLVCYILWVFYTSKKPIGVLNLKPFTEFDFSPLNRYLRPQLSFIKRKPLLCLLLPSPPFSKCCPTLSTYRVARNVGGSLIFFRAAILPFYYYYYYYHCHHHYHNIAETD